MKLHIGHKLAFMKKIQHPYMMRERHIFQSLTVKQEDIVGFGGNQREKIIGLRNIGNSSFPFINNVLIVD